MRILGVVLGACAGLLVGGCILDRVIVDEVKALDDGQSFAWKLEKGHYRVEMTASEDGAALEWVGAPCTGTPELEQSKSYTGACRFAADGQLVVSNPTVLGTGSVTSVTVKVTKLFR